MKHERNNLMKRSLEKWGRAPIILGVLEHPLFWGLEHPFSRRARALTIQRGTSTHYSKTNKQRASEQLQNGHERNEFMKMLSWKNGCAHPLFLGARAPIFLRARAPIFQKGMSTHYSKSNQMENKWTIAKWTWKEWVHENALLKKWVRAPLIFGGSSTHYFGGSSTHLFRGARALTIQRTLN